MWDQPGIHVSIAFHVRQVALGHWPKTFFEKIQLKINGPWQVDQIYSQDGLKGLIGFAFGEKCLELSCRVPGILGHFGEKLICAESLSTRMNPSLDGALIFR